jgi:hypothetical protein
MGIVQAVLAFLRALLVGRAALATENLALRHQIPVLQRSVKHPKLRKRDRIFWSWLSRIWKGWRSALVIAPRAPLQNPYAERVIGSIRRECLDHLIVLKERHLRAILSEHVAWYYDARAHLSLERNSPLPRPVCPPAQAKVVANAYLGDLHHCYTRAA